MATSVMLVLLSATASAQVFDNDAEVGAAGGRVAFIRQYCAKWIKTEDDELAQARIDFYVDREARESNELHEKLDAVDAENPMSKFPTADAWLAARRTAKKAIFMARTLVPLVSSYQLALKLGDGQSAEQQCKVYASADPSVFKIRTLSPSHAKRDELRAVKKKVLAVWVLMPGTLLSEHMSVSASFLIDETGNIVETPRVKAVGGLPSDLRLLEVGLSRAILKAAPFSSAIGRGEIKLMYGSEDFK